MNIIAADDLTDAAKKVVAAAKESVSDDPTSHQVVNCDLTLIFAPTNSTP